MFDLEGNNEKEIFPYNFITKENIFEADIESVGDSENPPWDKEKKKEFKEKLGELKLIRNEKWNVKEYTLYYCVRDVNILRNGFNKFRKMCKDEIKLDPINFISLSSMAKT